MTWGRRWNFKKNVIAELAKTFDKYAMYTAVCISWAGQFVLNHAIRMYISVLLIYLASFKTYNSFIFVTVSVMYQKKQHTNMYLLYFRIHIETLVHGNLTVKSALSLVETVENTLISNMKSKPLPHGLQTRARREGTLPDG